MLPLVLKFNFDRNKWETAAAPRSPSSRITMQRHFALNEKLFTLKATPFRPRPAPRPRAKPPRTKVELDGDKSSREREERKEGNTIEYKSETLNEFHKQIRLLFHLPVRARGAKSVSYFSSLPDNKAGGPPFPRLPTEISCTIQFRRALQFCAILSRIFPG